MNWTPAKGEDTAWSSRGACGASPVMIYIFDRAADSGGSRSNQGTRPEHRWEVREAATVCADCPVRGRCTDWAMDLAAAGDPPTETVLGGMWWDRSPNQPPRPIKPMPPLPPDDNIRHGDPAGWDKHRSPGNRDGTWTYKPCAPCREAHARAMQRARRQKVNA